MHCVNPGQLMTLNSISRSHLDGRCAVTRTAQFRPARLYIAFPPHFCCCLHAITISDPSSHLPEYLIASLGSQFFGPSQLLAVLQYP
jgi:hypothetical protein